MPRVVVSSGFGAFVVLALACLVAVTACSSSCNFTAWHPRRYAVYKLSVDDPPLQLDGVLNESAWQQVAWSEPFVDIQGMNFPLQQPWFETKVKMRYDHQFLYIGAWLQETALWANVTRRNQVVFHDNDFEVFVDPSGTTHGYKEFEMNVINTTWNLLLNKPYLNGGHENSTRVDPTYGFDMFGHGMRSAVFIPQGRVNDPSVSAHAWSCEIALPLDQLVRYTPPSDDDDHWMPQPGAYWRINFSRVEWLTYVDPSTNQYVKVPNVPENNWVWSPQGQIDMHLPEKWGYIQFREPPPTAPTTQVDPENLMPSLDPTVQLDPEWNLRFASFEFYEAQLAFKQVNGHFASHKAWLQPYFRIAHAFECLDVVQLQVVASSWFEAQLVLCTDASHVATIRADRFLRIVPSPSPSPSPSPRRPRQVDDANMQRLE